MAWRRYVDNDMAVVQSQPSASYSYPRTKFDFQGMLGVTIRFDSYHDAEEHLCRVTEVSNAANMYFIAFKKLSIMIKTYFFPRWKRIHPLI